MNNRFNQRIFAAAAQQRGSSNQPDQPYQAAVGGKRLQLCDLPEHLQPPQRDPCGPDVFQPGNEQLVSKPELGTAGPLQQDPDP